jgi:hypothetical protein
MEASFIKIGAVNCHRECGLCLLPRLGALRRQAAYCLRLSHFHFYSDTPVAQHLDLMAAEFHARALRAEFQAEFDSGEQDQLREWIDRCASH